MAGQLATASFDHQHPQAPDNRMQRPNLNARNEISPWIRWEGMQVYVVQEQKTYQLVGGTGNEHWQEIAAGGGASNFVGQFPTFDDLPDSGSPGDYAYVGTGDDFVQYNWDQIAGEWRLNSAETKVSDEDFFLGRVPSEPDRVMFSMRRNSIIYSTGGSQSISPDRMANYVFTGENVTLENVNYSGDGGEEFHITNRTGSNLTILGTGNFASGLTIPAGHMASFKSSDDGWVQSFVNEEVTFSDTLDSVNARISRGPDGKDVLSGIFDRNTGGVYNYKKLDSVPAIVDGNIFIGIGADFYKRIFTTPVDLESVGIIYNSEAAATNNTIILARLINMGQPICIKNKLYLAASNQNITADNLTIYGDNDSSELAFVNSGTLFSYPNTFGDWSIKRVKVSASNGRVFLVQKLNEDFYMNRLSFNDNVVDGPISFNFRGNSATSSKIKNIETNRNNVNGALNTFFQVVETGFDFFEVLNNKVRDFLFNFIYVALSSPEGREAKKLVVDGNDVVNSPSTIMTSESSLYFCFVLTQSYESVYTNNHVEGLTSLVRKAVYDIYQSSEVSTYSGNTYKNNMCFFSIPESDGIKALYKAKAGKEVRGTLNKFIIEKEFLSEFLANNPGTGLNMEDLYVSYLSADTREDNPADVIFTDNIIEVPYLYNTVMRNKSFRRLLVDRNKITADIIKSEFIHIRDGLITNGERDFSFSGNDVRCNQYVGNPRGPIAGSGSYSESGSKINLKVASNDFNNLNTYLMYDVAVDDLDVSSNNVFYDNPVSQPILIYDLKVRGNIVGLPNTYRANHNLEIFRQGVDIAEGSISNKMLLKGGRPSAQGLPLHRKNYNYTATRGFEIESPAFGKIKISVSVEHLWDGTDRFIRYKSFRDEVEYLIPYTPGVSLGNGTGNHNIYVLQSPKTLDSFGNIRMRVIEDTVVLCVDFGSEDSYTLSYKDSYVR